MKSNMRLERISIFKTFNLGLSIYLLANTVNIRPANAISLDSFSYANQAETESDKIRVEANLHPYEGKISNGHGAYGGTRSVEMTVLPGANGAGSSNIGYDSIRGNISHSSGPGAFSKTFISWDGDSTIGLSDYAGLSLDLTEGGATELRFETYYDFLGSETSDFVFTFYDASDASGNTFSRGIFNLNANYRYEDLSLAFSSLSIFGSNGAANLKNIGAYSLLIDGSRDPGADITFGNFRTNGGSTAVPEPGSIALLAAGVFGALKRRKKT